MLSNLISNAQADFVRKLGRRSDMTDSTRGSCMQGPEQFRSGLCEQKGYVGEMEGSRAIGQGNDGLRKGATGGRYVWFMR